MINSQQILTGALETSKNQQLSQDETIAHTPSRHGINARQRAIVPLLFIFLAGCESSIGLEGEQVYGAPGSPAWFNSAAPTTQREHFRGVCSSYGFTSGTAAHTQCVADETRSQRSDANRTLNRILADTSTTCTTFGNVTNCY